MSVTSYSIKYYVCVCDKCGKRSDPIKDTSQVYNRAQAARSIGWSYGKDCKVLCDNCRMDNWEDRYRYSRR